VELGPSYSGPIVSGERVFTTETSQQTTESLFALERATGRKLWQKSWEGALSVPFFAKANGDWIRSTPACDDATVFVSGMRDVLAAFDAATGEERWRVDFVTRYNTPLPAFGYVCSPLVTVDAIYTQAGAAVVRLDKKTGATVWRALDDGGGMWGSAFSSPILTELQGKQQLIVQTRTLLAGLDPADGKTLWSQKIEAFRGMNILTPTIWQGCVFTTAYGGKAQLYEIAREGDAWKPRLRWEQKTQGYMSSPVVIGDHAYLHLKNQRFTCLDLKTGESRWTTTPFGQYWSLIGRGDRLLALDERGTLYLIRANPEKFELLSERKVSDQPAWAHLAIVGGEIYIRELKALTCWKWG
jgi:outer membrane protein assembly factor BamB